MQMEKPVNDMTARMARLAEAFDVCRKAFIALGDENRQHIVISLLSHYGGMRVGEIAARINLSRPAVSHHLKILRDAGIVNMFKRGTMNYYHVDANESQWTHMTALITEVNAAIEEISKQGGGCCSREDD